MEGKLCLKFEGFCRRQLPLRKIVWLGGHPVILLSVETAASQSLLSYYLFKEKRRSQLAVLMIVFNGFYVSWRLKTYIS